MLLPADVLSVRDGDTFTARIHLWPHDPELDFTAKVRLDGCDAPELHTPLGPAARDYLAALLASGKVLIAWPDSREKFGRALCRVYVDRPGAARLDVVEIMKQAHQACEYHGEAKSLSPITGLPISDAPKSVQQSPFEP